MVSLGQAFLFVTYAVSNQDARRLDETVSFDLMQGKKCHENACLSLIDGTKSACKYYIQFITRPSHDVEHQRWGSESYELLEVLKDFGRWAIGSELRHETVGIKGRKQYQTGVFDKQCPSKTFWAHLIHYSQFISCKDVDRKSCTCNEDQHILVLHLYQPLVVGYPQDGKEKRWEGDLEVCKSLFHHLIILVKVQKYLLAEEQVHSD